MKNVTMSVKDNKLTIVVECDKEFGETASKKSLMVATTGGFALLPNGLKVSLNVTKDKV